MSWYKDFNLVDDTDGYSVVVYLNPDDSEFSGELVENLKKNILKLDEQIKKVIEENFADVKINSVKLVLGALVIGTIPFMTQAKAHAAQTDTTSIQQTTSQTYSVTTLKTKGVVAPTKLNVREGPSTNYSIIHQLWQGNTVKVIGESNGWCEIQLSDGRIGWVSKQYLNLDIQINDRDQKIQLLISSAKDLLGTPYVWGGTSLQDGGFDCSGFTKSVYKKVGYDLNRVSTDQAKQGVPVDKSDLQPGDLVFYSLSDTGLISHVGLYLGDGKMIHSPKTGDSVKITDITTGFWQSRFVTARRIIQ